MKQINLFILLDVFFSSFKTNKISRGLDFGCVFLTREELVLGWVKSFSMWQYELAFGRISRDQRSSSCGGYQRGDW